MKHNREARGSERRTPTPTEFDLEAKEYVPLSKGNVHEEKEVVSKRPTHASLGGNMSLMAAIQKSEKTESRRNQVLAELVPVVLFIEEAHMLEMKFPLKLQNITRKHDT